uniref:phenylalanine--tRNA ligase n=2 Tax=Paramormyrops kingsleyae TaxID=1676925 RepID=A0A3B3S937_9TELE|nr:ferredoxin-fold anticodon-binding domain-containing protein 1 isoform X1 [Paramormyrops kingsleyae]
MQVRIVWLAIKRVGTCYYDPVDFGRVVQQLPPDSSKRHLKDAQELSKHVRCIVNVLSGRDTMTAPREVLLVGEGNFSFSAALCQAAGGSAKVTATCFQAEDVARLQDGAAENIRRLSESGADMYYEVDGTALECTSLKQRSFDCIIFNFPHCGRKSGVKKNRSLLAKFFLSSIQVLKNGGEIHVALCNGQGGTPADKPTREWHNSWQAVAMAAEAGLILSQICPFDHEKYQSYKCTGYRSQDKGFHVEGALNHIFTHSLPYAAIPSINLEAVVGKEIILFEFPKELTEFANRNFLDPKSHHPVQMVQEQLLKELESLWPVQVVDVDFPFLFRDSPERLQACGPDITTSDIYWIRPVEVHNLGEEDCRPDGSQDSPTGNYGLWPSLLLHVQEVVQRSDFCPGVLFRLSGPVYRRVPVSRNTSPAFHQLLLVGALPSEPEPVGQLRNCLEMLLAPYGIALEEEDRSRVHELWLKVKGSFKVGRLEVLSAPDDVQQLCVVTLNLDLLAAQIFGVTDWRLLWSPDFRFLSHFLPSSPGPFRPFSLYPPTYVHDVSFWVEPDSFDELAFHSLVRRVSAGAVREATLVDRFRHPHMGHASMCYRLTYQSADRALSYSQALAMQLELRRLLPLELQVTMR